MIADPQPLVIRKKVGTSSVKPRPRKREQSLPLSDTTTSGVILDTTDSIENMSRSRSNAHRKKLPYYPVAIPIEDYIRHKRQPNFHKTLPTSVLSAVATSKAVDDAYDYLFKHLKGQCHGLNVITYPRVGKDDNTEKSKSGDKNDVNTVTRFAILAYIQPGTIYHDWEEIENGLVRIFMGASAKKGAMEDPKWHLEGVVFELWATKPMAWDFRSGHL